MQEEVENKTLTLMVNGTRFTGRMFKAAISKYMAHRREVKHQKQQKRDSPVIPHGKQTVKQLIGQNQGVSNIEINDPSIREFESSPNLCVKCIRQILETRKSALDWNEKWPRQGSYRQRQLP